MEDRLVAVYGRSMLQGRRSKAAREMARSGASMVCWNFASALPRMSSPASSLPSPQSVNLETNETVVFSWIVYQSRAHRDEVNDKVMKDPRMAEMMKPESMPFDGKRMIYGGFEMIVDL
jgi:uncharacterized protein YbaA (DUF1428 family)